MGLGAFTLFGFTISLILTARKTHTLALNNLSLNQAAYMDSISSILENSLIVKPPLHLSPKD